MGKPTEAERGTPCACEFDQDDKPIRWCRYHADNRDLIRMARRHLADALRESGYVGAQSDKAAYMIEKIEMAQAVIDHADQ